MTIVSMDGLGSAPRDARLFPRYMNSVDQHNQRSTGIGVTVLQIFLTGFRAGLPRGYGGTTPRLRVTGIYDDQTVELVMRLQRKLGFRGGDVDGNFGPETRAAVKARYDWDFNAIMNNDAFSETNGTGAYAQDDGSMAFWPVKP